MQIDFNKLTNFVGAERRHKLMLRGLLIGAVIITVEILQLQFAPQAIFRVSELFAFLAIAALPLPATLLAIFTGYIFEVLAVGDAWMPTHLSAFAILATLLKTEKNKVPNYLQVVATWGLIFIPAILYLGNMQADINKLSLLFFNDIFASILGTVLLSSETLCVWLGATRLSVKEHLHYVCAVLVAVNFASYVNWNNTLWSSANVISYTSLLSAALLLAFIASSWLAEYLSENSEELVDNQLSDKAFSSLADNYIKRNSSKQDLPEYFSESAEPSVMHKHNDSETGYCSISNDGTIKYINATFSKISQLVESEVIGKKFDELELNDNLRSAILRLLDGRFNDLTRKVEVKLNELPAKLSYVELDAKVVSNNNEQNNIVLSLRDISERRAINQEQLHEQRIFSLGNVVKGLTHDLNNTFMAISGMLGFARNQNSVEFMRRTMDEVLKTLGKAATAVRSLADYAEGSAQNAEALKLTDFFRSKQSLLGQLVGENVKLNYSSSDPELVVKADQNLLFQAVSNILINSREATGNQQGNIWINIDKEHIDNDVSNLISGSYPGDFVRLRISDDGMGMTADIVNKACDPLFSTKTDGVHSGLGLSTVYKIVRAHNGFITIESKQNHGTTVSIYFPEAELTEEQAVVTEAEQEVLTLSPANILVVEDDNQVRRVVEKLLESLGYKVTACSNGEDALKQCQEQEFDIILVDMIMPNMNGVEVIKQARETQSKAQALIMTAYGIQQDQVEDNIKVLPKPFDIEVLARTIQEALESQAQ